MTSLFALVAIALIVVGAIAFLRAGQQGSRDEGRAYVRDEQRHMPAEIAAAELLLSERQLFATLDGASVPVRPDQVYRTSAGLVVPVDSKTRNLDRVFPYDVIELSMQRLAVSESHVLLGRGTAALHGYIRIKDKAAKRAPSYHRVDLWARPKLEELYRRYLAIIAGQIEPTSQTNSRACAGCSYRSGCAKAL